MTQTAARIARDEDVMGGEPVIKDTRVTVLRVHALVHDRGLPPGEVASMHDLDVEAVRAAMDYYEANPDIVDAVETWREEVRRRSLDEIRQEHEDEPSEASAPE